MAGMNLKRGKQISNITFMPVVETISRKFALRRETCTLKTSQQKETNTFSYMGSGARVKMFNGGLVTQNYFFMRKNARTSALSADETTNRSNFRDVAVWRSAVRQDLSKLSANQAKYRESLNEHKTIKGVWAGDYSMDGFIFAIGMAILADGGTLPQDHALPSFDA